MSKGEQPDSSRSWVIAVIGSVAMIFTFGTPLSYGLFRDPFSEAFGVSPLALSGVFALMLFTFFVGSGVVGVFGGRFPARAIVVSCAVVTGIVAPSLFFLDGIVGLAIVFAVLGLSLGTVFVVVASVVPRWFERHRGTATGLIFVGNGLGLLVLPPVWQYAFAVADVRRGFLAIVGVTALSFVAAGAVCRRPAWAEQTSATTDELLGWLGQLGRTRTFRLLFVGIALSFGWYQLFAAYAVDMFAARGLSAASASAAFGFVGGVSIVSRLGGGVLADRVGTRRAFLGSLVSVIAGALLLFVPARPALLGAIVLLGLGLGGSATLYIPLLLEIYAPEKDTAVVGLFNVSAGVTALVMPSLGTWSVSSTGGFTLAIVLTLGTVLVGTATVAVGTAG